MLVRSVFISRWTFLVLVSVQVGIYAQAPTTVQLPTIQQFRVDTSVLVPDGGSASLGGVNSFQSGSVSGGVPVLGRVPGIGRAFNNRAFGANTNSGQVRVHATIHDLAEMDAALRGTEAARRVRERFALENANAASVYAGRGSIHGGGLFGGASIAPEDPAVTRARYLTENMGRSAVPKEKKTSVQTPAVRSKPTGKQPAAKANTNKSGEPPLILRGRQR